MRLQQKILINRDEDISSIVEKLVSSWADEIFLILPENAKIFGRFSDVQIIKEEAENLNKKLAIITPDRRGQAICLDVGIPVMDLDRIEITEKRSLESVWGPKKVFDITPASPTGGSARQAGGPVPNEAEGRRSSVPAGEDEPEYPAEEDLRPEPPQERELAEDNSAPEIAPPFLEEFEERREREEVEEEIGRPEYPENFGFQRLQFRVSTAG
ncbi:MAG: hypothetical protein Q8L57_01640 [bacterium]|nr:hypothetical protein [bacterium]